MLKGTFTINLIAVLDELERINITDPKRAHEISELVRGVTFADKKTYQEVRSILDERTSLRKEHKHPP